MSNVVELKQNAPVVGGVEIVVDERGRFNLNAIHKASGSDAAKKPSQWLRTKQAQELVRELGVSESCSENKQGVNSRPAQELIKKEVGGRSPGTFAHELLAISYAGWISPAFQLKVNKVFMDYRTGKLKEVENPELQFVRAAERAGSLIKEQGQLIQQQQLALEQNKVKAKFHDRVAMMPDDISVAEAAKIIGTGQKRLFAFLRKIRWITRRNEPYQEKIEQGLLDVKIGTWYHEELGFQRSLSTRVTGKGVIKLQQLWDADHPDGWELPPGTRIERLAREGKLPDKGDPIH